MAYNEAKVAILEFISDVNDGWKRDLNGSVSKIIESADGTPLGKAFCRRSSTRRRMRSGSQFKFMTETCLAAQKRNTCLSRSQASALPDLISKMHIFHSKIMHSITRMRRSRTCAKIR